VKSEKYPGLRNRFINELRTLLGDKELHLSSEIFKSLSEGGVFNTEELIHIESNIGNLMTYAKSNGVVVSPGTRRGYKLADNEDQEIGSETEPMQQEELPPQRKRKKQWESLLHLPATLVLSSTFRCLACSQRKKQKNNIQLSNPDMVLVRDRYSAMLGDWSPSHPESSGVLDNLKNFTTEPRMVISSVELKWDISTREEFLTAIAEAISNSSWANEPWLIFMQDPNRGLDNHPMRDMALLAVARRVDLGIGELVLHDDVLEIKIHNPPSSRRDMPLSLNNDFDIKALLMAYEAITSFNEEGGAYCEDRETDIEKMAVLLLKAIKNLSLQDGFTTLEQFLDSLGRLKEAGDKILPSILELSRNHLLEAVGLDDSEYASIKSQLEKEMLEHIYAAEREELWAKLEALEFI
jgi:hypothetical protein